MSVTVIASSVSVCGSSRFSSSSSRFSRRSSAGASSATNTNSSLDRPVRRRDVIRPMNITLPTATAAVAVAEEGGSRGQDSSRRNSDSHEQRTLAGIVLSVYHSSLLQDAAASKVEETTTMLSLVTPSRDQQQRQNRPAVLPSRTARDPEEIVRGKLRSKLLTKRSGVRLDDESSDNITAAAAEDPPGEEPSIFPIVKLDIIGPAPPSTAIAILLRRQGRDADPSTIDDAELFELSETSLGISSESLDSSKDDFNCSSSSSNINNRRTRSISSHRNSNVNVVRWVDTKNINNIADVDMRVLQRYANSFVIMAQEDEDEDNTEKEKMATAICGIDPDEEIISSSISSTTLDQHHTAAAATTTITTKYSNNNIVVNKEQVQTIITNSRVRIATISAGFKRSNYFVREDLDTRIYFSSIEDALGYMSVRGYSKMMGEEELDWRELFRRAHGVVKVCESSSSSSRENILILVFCIIDHLSHRIINIIFLILLLIPTFLKISKIKHKQRYRKGKLVMILKKIITDNDDDYVDRIVKKKKHKRLVFNDEEGGDFENSCTTLTIAETERTSLGKSIRGPYESYSEKFIAIQENLKRQCLLAIMEGRSLSDVDYHGDDDDDDDGGGMLLLTNGPATDSSSSIGGSVDPDPDINLTRRLTIASSSTYASNYRSSNKSKSVNDVVTWKSGVTCGSVSMSRRRAITTGGVNSAPGVLEQVNDEITKAPSVALGSARRGTYGGGVRYFTPDNSFYKSEGGTQSDTFEEIGEKIDYDEEDDDEEYEEDEDEEADNSMSDNGTLVINEEGTCVSSLGNFTSKTPEDDESSTNSTIASYVIDERSGSADTLYRPFVKDVKTTKNKSDKKKEKKSKKDKTKSR